MLPNGADGSTLASFDLTSLQSFCPRLGVFTPEVLKNLKSFKKKGTLLNGLSHPLCLRVDTAADNAPLIEIQCGIAR